MALCAALTLVLFALPALAGNGNKAQDNPGTEGGISGSKNQEDGRPGTPAGFEIDGDLLSHAGASDWFPNGGGTGVLLPGTCGGNPAQAPSFLGHDNIWRGDVDGKFKTRSNKNDDHIGMDQKPWNWASFGGNPPKNDITEIYGHQRTDGAGNRWIMMGAGTRAPQGDNHTDFEFNQAGLTLTGDTEGLIIGNGPDGGRTVGDLLVSLDEVNGSRILVPTLRRWDGENFILVPESEWTGKFFAAHNSRTLAATPCGAVDQKGVVRGSYEEEQFLEAAINASLLIGPDFGECGGPGTIMVKTRSSHSWTAELKDFALGLLQNEEQPACLITGPNTICAGTPVELCGPAGPGLSYLWSTGETTQCIQVVAQATYTLTVFGGDCGPVMCSKTLTASSVPVCNISGPSLLCPGQTAQLCGPEGFQGTEFTYLWNTGQTSRCITISQPGDYTLTVSTPNCGSLTCTKTVGPGTALACTITGPNDIDPGGTAQLCGPDGPDFSYAWSTGETTRCITITEPGTYTLTVSSPSCGSSTCTRVVLDRPTSSCRCSFFYPDDSNLPRSQQDYHESSIVTAIVPGRSGCPIGDTELKLWYNDETALGLGIRRVVVYTSPTDSTVTDYPVTPSGAPQCVSTPDVGATSQTNILESGNDTAVDGGRPIWPVLYVTDITLDKDARDGDWEQGSTQGIPAHQVCGVWTTGVRRVLAYDNNRVIIQMDPSPAANGWTLGAGSDVPPGGFGMYPDQGYGAEVTWDLTQLGFLPGHRYRLYTIVHDGDQTNPDGGDAGRGCTRIVVSQQGIIGLDDEGGIHIGESSRLTSTVKPTSFELAQNYPNPFKVGTRTALRFSLPERSTVKVGVYTVAGQRVATLAEGTMDAGNRMIEWTGTDSQGRQLSPGMYVCKLEASASATGRFVQMRKMMLVK